MDACTVAVLDAITAFAVLNPSGLSQDSPVFSGPDAWQVTPPRGSLSLLRTGKSFNLSQPFQPSTEAILVQAGKMSTPKVGAIETKNPAMTRVSDAWK